MAPFSRAADTQKCIRAGGKHNDLEDVGFDTYHHTFFEMLGNWSFGNYFKKEAIEWAWELLVSVWKFPPSRLTQPFTNPEKKILPNLIRKPMKYGLIFSLNGLDPSVHIVPGGKKDNFWMMGETGPCGPCSELHLDLTPDGNTRGTLVNADSHLCIEIWNLVFIQFNADREGNFTPYPPSMSIREWDLKESPQSCSQQKALLTSQNQHPIMTPIVSRVFSKN